MTAGSSNVIFVKLPLLAVATVMAADDVLPEAVCVAVTVAVPTATPLTTPAASTVATAGFDEANVEPAVTGPVVALL